MLGVLPIFIYFTAVVYATEYIDCNDGGFYIRADPKSTKHFYKCDNGRPVRFMCPDSLIYNQNSHVCDWPRNVQQSVKGTQEEASNLKPLSYAGQQYSSNNQKPYNSGMQYNSYSVKPYNNDVKYNNNYDKPSNNKPQYAGNNVKQQSYNDVQYGNSNMKSPNSKPKNAPTSSGKNKEAGFKIPWHYQSYSTDIEDIYPVQIINNNLKLDGLGYTDSTDIDIR